MSNVLIVHPHYCLRPLRIIILSSLKNTPELLHEFCDVPQDIVYLICSKLKSPRDLVSFGMTCKGALEASREDSLWRELCVNTFWCSPSQSLTGETTWQRLYKYNYRAFKDLFTQMQARTFLGGIMVGGQIHIPIMTP